MNILNYITIIIHYKMRKHKTVRRIGAKDKVLEVIDASKGDPNYIHKTYIYRRFNSEFRYTFILNKKTGRYWLVHSIDKDFDDPIEGILKFNRKKKMYVIRKSIYTAPSYIRKWFIKISDKEIIEEVFKIHK